MLLRATCLKRWVLATPSPTPLKRMSSMPTILDRHPRALKSDRPRRLRPSHEATVCIRSQPARHSSSNRLVQIIYLTPMRGRHPRANLSCLYSVYAPTPRVQAWCRHKLWALSRTIYCQVRLEAHQALWPSSLWPSPVLPIKFPSPCWAKPRKVAWLACIRQQPNSPEPIRPQPWTAPTTPTPQAMQA